MENYNTTQCCPVSNDQSKMEYCSIINFGADCDKPHFLCNHVNCRKGLECSDYNCPLGHPVNTFVRKQINDIVSENIMDYNPETYCKYGLTCINRNCTNSHKVEYDHRVAIKQLFHDYKMKISPKYASKCSNGSNVSTTTYSTRDENLYQMSAKTSLNSFIEDALSRSDTTDKITVSKLDDVTYLTSDGVELIRKDEYEKLKKAIDTIKEKLSGFDLD